jgi:hypothetical protein
MDTWCVLCDVDGLLSAVTVAGCMDATQVWLHGCYTGLDGAFCEPCYCACCGASQWQWAVAALYGEWTVVEINTAQHQAAMKRFCRD